MKIPPVLFWIGVSLLRLSEVNPHWKDTLADGAVPRAVKLPLNRAEYWLTLVAFSVVTVGGTGRVVKLRNVP